MSASNLEDKIFDTILKQAFIDENDRAMSELTVDEEWLANYKPSRKHKKAMKKIMRKYVRPPLSLSKKIQRVTIIFLAVLGIGAGALSISPNVRAAYQQALAEWFDKYTIFDFNTINDDVTVGDYSMTYLPKGFAIIDSIESQSRKSFYFEDGKGNYIHFSYMPGNLSSVLADNEERIYEPVSINNNEAYLLKSVDDESIIVVWINNDIVFFLSGDMQTSELIEIAKKIK